MYHKKIEDDIRSPLDYGLSILCGKWKVRILCLLDYSGNLRFGQLKHALGNISDGVLAQTLNDLVSDKIIEKIADDLNPATPHYQLTEQGRKLIPMLRSICRWSCSLCQELDGEPLPSCRNCDNYIDWLKDHGKNEREV